MKRRILPFFLLLSLLLCATKPDFVKAAALDSKRTNLNVAISASGEYSNWEGVSNISQFTGSDGCFCFALNKSKKVVVYRTNNGNISSKIKLKKKHDRFGAVCQDTDGNYYLVTGKANTTDDPSKETIFVSKYDSNGTHISTIGDSGGSSLADYYDNSFYTKTPFDAGNCDVAWSNGILAVNYGRGMYNGHQSNSVWFVDTETMETLPMEKVVDENYTEPTEDDWWSGYSYSIYNSHSFGQRAIPFQGGFLFMSEGDAYNRAFTLDFLDRAEQQLINADIFHFWLPKNSSDNMFVVNNNFAHIGDLTDLSNGYAAFVGTSAKAMTKKANNQPENVFIQIFDPKKDLNTPDAYRTAGERSGTTGLSGTEEATDYGVLWLTSGKNYHYRRAQAASDETGNTIVLYERYGNDGFTYDGIFCSVVGADGNVLAKSKLLSSSARLNPCETPVYADGFVWWAGNSTADNAVYIYRVKI